MLIRSITTTLCILFGTCSFAQYQQYIQLVTPFLSDSIQSGFFYFNTPNNFQAGQLYQTYKLNAPDLNNNMILTDQHVDSLIGFTHLKYQQTFMDIPVEGAGCIEHYDTEGSLSYINAKVADSIKKNHVPILNAEEAISGLIKDLKKEDKNIIFAWEDEDWENEIQIDENDSTATWFPTAELIWAIDSVYNVQLIIPGSRYTLAYKILVTFIQPEQETFYYYVDANTGNILKKRTTHRHDGSAAITGYGTRTIDTRWKGGFTQGYILNTNNGTRNIHTKKNPNGFAAWGLLPETKTSNDMWGNTYETETTVHYHVSNSWDYYRSVFGRTGQDNAGREIRVRSQWNANNAVYRSEPNKNYATIALGKTTLLADYGTEPSIVAHEFTHGVIYHTSNLDYEHESGALNESFSDIFGIVIHATMLDGGNTDWIIGNFISNNIQKQRSLKQPKTMGEHVDSTNTLVLGQPDTFNGINWYNGHLDYGGVHINSGVQNKWFYVLANGDTGYNDLNNYYDVEGIGMTKAAKIAYYAMTSGLFSSAQFTDSRQSTINFAKNHFGECSKEYIATINAWYAVGLGYPSDCPELLVEEFIEQNILVYPNPTTGKLTIDIPKATTEPIRVYDISGKLVQEIKSNNTLFNVDINSLENGVYLLHFDFGGNTIVKRIILQQ